MEPPPLSLPALLWLWLQWTRGFLFLLWRAEKEVWNFLLGFCFCLFLFQDADLKQFPQQGQLPVSRDSTPEILELCQGGLGWIIRERFFPLKLPREWAQPQGCQSSRRVWEMLPG